MKFKLFFMARDLHIYITGPVSNLFFVVFGETNSLEEKGLFCVLCALVGGGVTM